MAMRGRLQVPPGVRRGEPFEVRVIVQHPMETGFRRDYDGKVISLDIVNRLACHYGGREVFRAELGSGVAANPYFVFYVVAGDSGELTIDWSDDHGQSGHLSAMVKVV
jgi:sulfur-oxidizing protein SoxZ